MPFRVKSYQYQIKDPVFFLENAAYETCKRYMSTLVFSAFVDFAVGSLYTW